MITTLPTLAEACAQLRIGRVTLDKWCKRLGITPERHVYDLRYFTLTPEQVQQIAEARAQMPGATPKWLDAAVASPQPNLGEQSGGSDRFPISLPPKRPRTPRHVTPIEGPMPASWMSRTDAADRHGIPRSTFRRWCDDGRIETVAQRYGGDHGTFAIEWPVTQKGLAQLWTLASRKSGFVRCDRCPHEQEIAEE